MPVAASTSTAFCGQTATHGVWWPHCWQRMGKNTARLSGNGRPLPRRWTRIQVMPVRSVALGLAGGTLFSTAQATMQAPQPVQRSRSITIPYRADFVAAIAYALLRLARAKRHVPSVATPHAFNNASGRQLPLADGPT